VHVTSTCGGAVQGAMVYGTPTPFNQFDDRRAAPARRVGDAHLPAAGELPGQRKQQILAMFLRARKPGENVLDGITGYRLVSVPVEPAPVDGHPVPTAGRGPSRGGPSSVPADVGYFARDPSPARSRPGADPERGFVVAVLRKGADPAEELAEIRELARTAGVDPVATLVQPRVRPDPATYVGKGKLEELKHAFASRRESLLVDDELAPSQQRRLENLLQARVVDRTQLILDIFAQHARSAEGKLQVELASSSTTCRGCAACGSTSSGSAGVGTRGPRRVAARDRPPLARRRISLLKAG
jgi:hypothetical protein